MLFFKSIGYCVSCSTLTVLAFVPLAAAEAKGHEQGFSTLIPYWVNFILFVGLLYFLLRKKARAGWAQRRETIENNIDRALAELQQAEQKLHQALKNLDNVAGEASKVEDLLRKEAITEHDAIIAEAKSKAELIIKRAKETAEAEKTSAIQALRSEMVERVVQRARERLLDRLSPAFDYERRQQVLGSFKQMLR